MLAAADVPANVLAGLRKLTGTALSELKDRIARRQPVLMLPLFDNQYYESGGAMVRAVVEFLDSNGSAFAAYELAEGERFKTRDENLSRISSDNLKNIFREANVE
ncbi:hypothetical protein [Shinella zoogloeoides]